MKRGRTAPFSLAGCQDSAGDARELVMTADESSIASREHHRGPFPHEPRHLERLKGAVPHAYGALKDCILRPLGNALLYHALHQCSRLDGIVEEKDSHDERSPNERRQCARYREPFPE